MRGLIGGGEEAARVRPFSAARRVESASFASSTFNAVVLVIEFAPAFAVHVVLMLTIWARWSDPFGGSSLRGDCVPLNGGPGCQFGYCRNAMLGAFCRGYIAHLVWLSVLA